MPLFPRLVSGQDEADCQPYKWSFGGLRMRQGDPLPTEGTPTNVTVGEVNCRYWTTTPAEVNYYTCSQMSQRYGISNDVLFSLNPSLSQDCSNVQAETDYCVRGFIEPVRAFDGLCGPPNNGATCLGTEMQCCNSETWTCGNSTADCAPGTCYEGACEGDIIYSTDGTCGQAYGSRSCAGRWGTCCSVDGQCGTGDAYCGLFTCQEGDCDIWKQDNQPEGTPWTPDGTCGGADGFRCSAEWGRCCNVNDICGERPADCYLERGCQSQFGVCASDPNNTTDPDIEGFRMLGCYDDLSAGWRTLGWDSDWQEELTIESCKAYCVDTLGYYFFGVEYSNECYCADFRDETSSRVDDYECDMPCAGDSSQTCGGDTRINIYGSVNTPSHVWLGCRTNSDAAGQALEDHSFTSVDMTNELCGTECEAEGPFDYYGTEDGDTCRCGDTLRPSSKMAPQNECNVGCAGDFNWDCGGDERLTTFGPNPIGPTYIYQGCHTDEDESEWALDGPWGWSDDSNTAWQCGYWCLYEGYDYFGTADGGYCVCGNGFHQDSVQTNEAECNVPCTGDESEMCGTWGRMSIYWWDWSGYYAPFAAARGAVSAPVHNISAVKPDIGSAFSQGVGEKPAARVRVRD
ncbi:hypothetical protein OQA88_640 [Cercophora sp. LCS_1]